MTTETVNLTLPDQGDMIAEAEKTLAVARAYHIDSPEMYQLAGTELKEIKGKIKVLETQRKSITDPLNAAKSRIMDLFRRPIDFLTDAEASLKRAMLTFQREEERKRQEAERIAQEATRKEQERLRKAAEKKAAKAEAKGDEDKAQELRENVPVLPLPTVAPTPRRVAGVSTREIWKARIVDESLIPRKYLVVNEKMLGDIARSTKGAVEIPGVEFYAEETIAAASR